MLRVAAKLDRATIGAALRRLCNTSGVVVAQEPLVVAAVDRYERGPADFSDYLILETAKAAGALPVRTFDRRFGQDPDVPLVEPGSEVET